MYGCENCNQPNRQPKIPNPSPISRVRMEKGKRIESLNGEILLPEPIIQHIQSFLSGKQAAQTSVLSKSWYSAWLTRPNLDFAERDYPFRAQIGFYEFMKKTMQRYQELNLKIESFRLLVSGSWMNCYEWYKSSLANELIVKAMKLGATDLDFELVSQRENFILPHEVLGAETLIRLSVIGCKIDLGLDGKVRCSRLKSLSLRRVYTEGDIIWDIISSCPLIEKLVLSECKCLFKFDVVRTRTRMLVLNPRIESGRQNVGSGVDGPINFYEFHKLKCLLLEKVDIGTWIFHDFSSKFPCLKGLALHHCIGYREIQISSHSLECISFSQARMLRAKFDVPNIHKFKFSGSCIPSLSFKTVSREWESDISISCTRNRTHLNTSWFHKFKEFLIELSPSTISLSLNLKISSENSYDYAGDIQGLPKPVVENLTLLMDAPSSVCSALLDGLFWSCRPKFITQYWLPKSCIRGKADNDFLKLLCKTLIQEASENCCIPNQNMSDLHDLEEVNVEFFEEDLAEWRPLSWKTLLDSSEKPENKQKIRFKLRWGRDPITFK